MVRVAALQRPHAWGDPRASLRRLEGELDAARDADLVLLPELSLTGYVSPAGDFDLGRFAEPADGPTARELSRLAAERGLALAGPLVERDGERLFNSLLLFDDRGARIALWRKRHPWMPERWASPGDLGSPVVEWRGLRITAAICFDVHFLDEAAESLDRSDVLLYPSAWVEEGPDTRVGLLRERARRHGLFVVNANWGAGAPALPGQGGSVIVGPGGRVVARAGPGAEAIAAGIESRKTG